MVNHNRRESIPGLDSEVIEKLYLGEGTLIPTVNGEDQVDYECKVCTGCFASGETTINFTPTFLMGPNTPIDMFVHQDLISKIHVCKATGPSANVWVTRKIHIPFSMAEALKAHPSVSAGPVMTDPEWRLARDE
jgi:hypothetical protein